MKWGNTGYLFLEEIKPNACVATVYYLTIGIVGKTVLFLAKNRTRIQ